MSTRVDFLLVALAVVVAPYLVWRVPAVRRVAPLAVVQIMAGVLLGPSGLGLMLPALHHAVFTGPVLAQLDGVATAGVLLYVFVTGLHLHPATLRTEGRRLGSVAAGSVLVPLALGAAAGWWMAGIDPGAASAGLPGFVASVAICIAVTALPVLAAILREMGLLGTRIGQTGLAVAALNDAALWVMLAVVLAVAGRGEAGLLGLAGAALWFGVMVVVIRPVLARLGRNGIGLVAGVGLAILSAMLSEHLGTGYLIGAFAAGAIMPESCRGALLEQLETVTATVLLPFFFMSTGLKALIQPGSAAFLAITGLALAATLLGKVAGTALPARRLGFSWSDSLTLGAMMQTKGLMEVVVLTVLHDAGLIGTGIFSAMVVMAVICTLLTAPAVRLAQAPMRASPWRDSPGTGKIVQDELRS